VERLLKKTTLVHIVDEDGSVRSEHVASIGPGTPHPAGTTARRLSPPLFSFPFVLTVSLSLARSRSPSLPLVLAPSHPLFCHTVHARHVGRRSHCALATPLLRTHLCRLALAPLSLPPHTTPPSVCVALDLPCRLSLPSSPPDMTEKNVRAALIRHPQLRTYELSDLATEARARFAGNKPPQRAPSPRTASPRTGPSFESGSRR
jgi:hypothetical protein